MEVDWTQAAQDIVRTLRGASTQTALSRRLGFKTNVLYRWESGQRQLRLSELIRILQIRRQGYIADVWAFTGRPARDDDQFSEWDWPAWLKRVRGSKSIDDLATASGIKSSALRRIFRGDSDPTVARFLLIVQCLTGRIVDFIELMTDASQITAIQPYWQVVDAQRRIARDHLNAEVIIAALEIEGYRDLAVHSDEWIAGRLGLTVTEIAETLAALEQAGAIQRTADKYTVRSHRHVNTQLMPDAWMALSRFWAERGLEQPVESCRRGYLVFSANEDAIRAVQDIYRTAHHQAVQVIQEGLNPTRLVAISTQFAFLDGKPKL